MILRQLASGRAAGRDLYTLGSCSSTSTTSSSSSSSALPALGTTTFRSCFHASARRADHYQTLEVPKNATQQDIKAQFYKLSKKWHPDVNPDSKDANQKFQQVSEAYATIGHADSRKDYDRQMSSSRYGSPRGASRGGSGGGFRYASDNVQRRASASYAWEYQRRRSQPRTGNSSGSTADNAHSSARAQYHEFGRGGASQPSGSSSMFEQFAERERRREAFAAARAGESRQTNKKSEEEGEEKLGSPLIRFLQVAGMFYIVFNVGTMLGSNQEGKKASPSSR